MNLANMTIFAYEDRIVAFHDHPVTTGRDRDLDIAHHVRAGDVGGCGTVFSRSFTGAETVLHRFDTNGEGIFPEGGLTSLHGTLYGVTLAGGKYDKGTIYAIAPDGTERVGHAFNGSTDGASPVASLVNVNGILYGTARDEGPSGGGTIFAFKP